MASLLVLLIIAGYSAYLYLKSTLVKSFATLIIIICASTIAFNYFETLADVFISRAGDSRFPALVGWAGPLCFILLFVLTFAILQTISMRLTVLPIDLGLWPERIGRIVCGIFSGLIISGLLLTVIAMAPLSNKYPYQRFHQTNPDPHSPNKVLFNVDGFATGWFSILSKGVFSSEKSFATLHPDFLDQLFLNKHRINDGVSIITDPGAIEVPRKTAFWPAPPEIKDTEGNSIPAKSGHTLTIVRIGIKKKAITNTIKNAGKFTLSQIRVICKQKIDPKRPLTGKAKATYPIGYLTATNQLEIKPLDSIIDIKYADIEGPTRWIDFAFYVPEGFVPLLVEFKQNSATLLPPAAITSPTSH